MDPRHYQIAALTGLLTVGTLRFGFDIEVPRVTATLGAALATQWLGGKLSGVRFDPRSPLISGLSLCLLLRTASPLVAAAAGAIAIGSKFLIRHRKGHVFNPSAFALVVFLLIGEGGWVSPGQWGSAAWFGFLLVSAGSLVVYRSARSDVTLAFLACYAAVLCGRAAWLGDPWAIPLHQLQSGSLLLFAFHMISDPKTTPDSRAGRILFALLVALGAGCVHFVLFRPNGLVWSLIVLSPLIPLIDRLLPGTPYRWQPKPTPPAPTGLILKGALR